MTHATSTELVLAERRGPVLVLTLNRPERLNAWTDALEDRYYARLDAAEDDAEVRAIVVTGAGRGFSAGADMSDLERAATTDAAEPELRNRPRPRSFPLTVRKPMIAAINGAAVGLGLVVALYCDLRFATPDAKLCTTFVADARDTARVSAGTLYDDVLVDRLSARGRDGDAPGTVRRRLAVYHEQTEPLIAYHRGSGRLTRIDGVGSTEESAHA